MKWIRQSNDSCIDYESEILFYKTIQEKKSKVKNDRKKKEFIDYFLKIDLLKKQQLNQKTKIHTVIFSEKPTHEN